MIYPDTLINSTGDLFLPCAMIQNKIRFFVQMNISSNVQCETQLRNTPAHFWGISFPRALASCQSDVTDLYVRQFSIHYLWRLIKWNVEVSLTTCIDIMIVSPTEPLTKYIYEALIRTKCMKTDETEENKKINNKNLTQCQISVSFSVSKGIFWPMQQLTA